MQRTWNAVDGIGMVSIAQHDQARIGVSLPNKVTEESSERLDEKEFGSLDGRKVPHMRNK